MSTVANPQPRRLPASAPALAPYTLAAVFAVTVIGGTLPAPLYPLWAPELGFGPLTTTLIFAAYALGTIAALLTLGGLSDQAGRRPVLLGALALTASAGVLFAVAQSVAALVSARVLSGLAVGMVTATATAALADLDEARPGRAARLATLANMGGLGLGAVLAGVLAAVAADPTRDVFLVHLVAVVGSALLVAVLPETVEHRRRPRLAAQRPVLPPAPHGPAFVRAAAIAFAAFALLGLFSSLVPAFLRVELGQDGVALAGAVVGSVFLLAAVTQLLVGPHHEGRARRAAPGVMLAGLAAVVAGLFAASFGVFLAGAALSGIGVGLAFKSGVAVVQRLGPPEHRAGLNAAFFLAAYAGLTVPSIALGALSQTVAPAVATLIAAAAVAVIVAAATMAAARARP